MNIYLQVYVTGAATYASLLITVAIYNYKYKAHKYKEDNYNVYCLKHDIKSAIWSSPLWPIIVPVMLTFGTLIAGSETIDKTVEYFTRS